MFPFHQNPNSVPKQKVYYYVYVPFKAELKKPSQKRMETKIDSEW